MKKMHLYRQVMRLWVAVKDALMAWSYMPEWRDEEILEAIAEFPSAQPTSSKMEQVPTRCDLIDRQAAINKILGQPPEPHYPSWYAEQIKELPTAEPKKSRGKWIEDKGQQTLMRNFIEMGEVWRVCSVCGAGHMIGHKYAIDKAYHDRHHNFCPNCGAKMEVTT